jgi:hypothetical protein
MTVLDGRLPQVAETELYQSEWTSNLGFLFLYIYNKLF